MQSSEKMEGIPAGRYSVLFYGTHETAIMKKNDLYDYHAYRNEYEVQRKIKVNSRFSIMTCIFYKKTSVL